MKKLTSTKIIATLGPTSNTRDKIRALAKAGVTMFRLNSSHENEAIHLERLNDIRAIEEELGYPIPTLLDLQGPKIRVGLLDEPIELVKDEIVKFRNQEKYEDGVIPVDYKAIAQDINGFSPDLIWISLGAPKQEVFISKLYPYIDSGILVAIGAAFNLFLGDTDNKLSLIHI